MLRVRAGGALGEAPFVPYYSDTPEDVALWLEQRKSKGAWMVEEGAPRTVRLAADLLLHDLEAQKRGVPVWKLLSMRDPGGARACRSIGIPEDLDDYSEQIRRLSKSFRILKLKLGSGNVDFDEAVVATAREAAPEGVLFADVNGGWSVREAAVLLPRLEKYGLVFVEQPVSHAGGHEAWRELAAALPKRGVPLYADESVQGESDVRGLAGWIEGINVKLFKTSGYAGALACVSAARTLGLRVMLGCMIESSIGVTAAAHLAASFDWVDLDGHLYLLEDDFSGLTFDENGCLHLPSRPGLGLCGRKEASF